MSKKACLYPGSFDPVTKGHLDLIRRACALYDTVYVGILYNPDKTGLFTPEERKTLLEKELEDLGNVKVVVWDGLTVDLMKKLRVKVALRGVRNSADVESETAMAWLNRTLYPEMETVFLPADAGLAHVSSSAVWQIASFGGDVSA
ncbi:MAG: pantetheine-phosphate adenylyltransferase, partial [Clostridiales bacterium]|nr:pantetheine-phosphate adenylyltransferase [Clostridiales bacterium]